MTGCGNHDGPTILTKPSWSPKKNPPLRLAPAPAQPSASPSGSESPSRRPDQLGRVGALLNRELIVAGDRSSIRESHVRSLRRDRTTPTVTSGARRFGRINFPCPP